MFTNPKASDASSIKSEGLRTSPKLSGQPAIAAYSTLLSVRSTERNETSILRKIGAGSCGAIFHESEGDWVFKVAMPGWDADLQNDYVVHTRVRQALLRARIDIQIPAIQYWVAKNDDLWWVAYKRRIRDNYSDLPSVLSTQRIRTVPKFIREAMIDRWCPSHLTQMAKSAPENEDCLFRVYCGARRLKRTKPARWFNLRNYGLYLDHLQAWPEEAKIYASTMGEALAVMHWEACTDARDVEFVLGGVMKPYITPLTDDRLSETLKEHKLLRSTWQDQFGNFLLEQRVLRLTLLDFNQCRTIAPNQEGVKLATAAFFINDPYFPRPQEDDDFQFILWILFKDAYLTRSAQAMDYMRRTSTIERLHALDLDSPCKFIDAIVAEHQNRQARRAAALDRLESKDD